MSNLAKSKKTKRTTMGKASLKEGYNARDVGSAAIQRFVEQIHESRIEHSEYQVALILELLLLLENEPLRAHGGVGNFVRQFAEKTGLSLSAVWKRWHKAIRTLQDLGMVGYKSQKNPEPSGRFVESKAYVLSPKFLKYLESLQNAWYTFGRFRKTEMKEQTE